jgi:glycosyltransferase involved in cell wall biosynthesis
MKKEAILITSNFSSDTGFAWKFFFRLFNIISIDLHNKGINICLSFAKVVLPITILNKNIPFNVFSFDPLNLSLHGVLELLKNIKKHNIRYGYFTDFPPGHWLYALLRLIGMKKIVVHSHVSVAAPYPPKSERGIKKLIKSFIHSKKSFSADRIYACSDFVKDRLVRKACCPETKIKIIKHGIDLDKFKCEVYCSGDLIKILTIARATREKGVHILIEATRLLRNRYKKRNFIVEYGGVGPDLKYFMNMVKNYNLENEFQFLGALDDTKEKICAADIVVVPSCWGDAYPLSVIEAMSAGKALIATDVGGIPEEVGNSDNAIIIKPNNSDMLAEALAGLMDNKEKRIMIGKNAKDRSKELFCEKRFHREVLTNLKDDLWAACPPELR